ncbi:MAG: carboxypeptidase-like regulatory domain-containing protein [Bacteroidales bacterium]
MRRLLSKVFFVLLLFVGLKLFALEVDFKSDTTLIEGYICDSIDDIPLQYASISIENTHYSAISDSSGYFIIPNITEIDCILIVRFLGYYDHKRKIHLQKAGNIIKIGLMPIIDRNADSLDIIEYRMFPLKYK